MANIISENFIKSMRKMRCAVIFPAFPAFVFPVRLFFLFPPQYSFSE